MILSVHRSFVVGDTSKRRIRKRIWGEMTFNSKQQQSSSSSLLVPRNRGIILSLLCSVFCRLIDSDRHRDKEQQYILCHAWEDLEKKKTREKNTDSNYPRVRRLFSLPLVVFKVTSPFYYKNGKHYYHQK
jgi:hypothetical protein